MKHIKSFDESKNSSSLHEGRTFMDTKKRYPSKAWDPDKKADFRDKIKSHVKSLGCKTKQVGNDLEVFCDGDVLMQVMFRDDYIGVKKIGNKFVDEFEYTELGKIKSKVTEIIKHVVTKNYPASLPDWENKFKNIN